ncbi:hypothetical protein AMECASPLE_032880 [Ameca splendens]|uniref:TERF1-interacting nuclear factor 2 N-terminal domain-containing protein n=1 Tax=Ameca splendens TaxID=208324 RepID=A0ABV0YTS5_9TELE
MDKSQREMFLMRKNHADFQSLAQTLAINKEKLEDYIKNEMEEQYGERYAQKVEDRLVDYLHELEKGFPGDSYIEKIMKKQSAETEEDKFLLEVLSPDSSAVRKLLHCAKPRKPHAAPASSQQEPVSCTQLENDRVHHQPKRENAVKHLHLVLLSNTMWKDGHDRVPIVPRSWM